jgi:hypothetical protein
LAAETPAHTRNSLKILIAQPANIARNWLCPHIGPRRKHHEEGTCAACDSKLDANGIKVRIGGRTVEVCCENCAKKLNEAHAARENL